MLCFNNFSTLGTNSLGVKASASASLKNEKVDKMVKINVTYVVF